MNIGVDLDNTLFDTNKIFLKYLKKFLREQNIDYFEWYNNSVLREEFYKLYLHKINNEANTIKNAKDIINILRKRNNKIFIITNRSAKYEINCYNNIKYLLRSNNIEYDGLYMVTDDKVKICQELKIDFMIDDNIEIYNKLNNNNINAILFDKDSKYDNMYRKVSDWNEIINIIFKSKD